MAKELKKIICKDLKSRFMQLDGCVLIDYRGLDAEQTYDLRCALRQSGVQMNVLQNRLARRVFADLGASGDFCDLIRGPTAILFGGEGAFTASKSIAKWRQKNQNVGEIRGGLAEGEALSPEEVGRLGEIPEPEVLRATLAGLLLSPATYMSSCAQGLVSHFAGCAQAQVTAKEEEEQQQQA